MSLCYPCPPEKHMSSERGTWKLLAGYLTKMFREDKKYSVLNIVFAALV